MRLPVFSSESIRLPFRWSLARRSSSAGTGSLAQAPQLLEGQAHHLVDGVEAGARVDGEAARRRSTTVTPEEIE